MRILVLFLLLSMIGAKEGKNQTLISFEQSRLVEARPIDSVMDKRDSTRYKVVLVDSLYWFNEELTFETPNSVIMTAPKSSKKSWRLYAYGESKTACPEGWRLPTVKEFDALMSNLTDTSYSGITVLPYGWQEVNDNILGFVFTKTGYLHKKKHLSKESYDIWLEDRHDAISFHSRSYHVHMYDTNRKNPQNTLTVFRHTHKKFNPKKNRKFAIRCVCKAKSIR